MRLVASRAATLCVLSAGHGGPEVSTPGESAEELQQTPRESLA